MAGLRVTNRFTGNFLHGSHFITTKLSHGVKAIHGLLSDFGTKATSFLDQSNYQTIFVHLVAVAHVHEERFQNTSIGHSEIDAYRWTRWRPQHKISGEIGKLGSKYGVLF